MKRRIKNTQQNSRKKKMCCCLSPGLGHCLDNTWPSLLSSSRIPPPNHPHPRTPAHSNLRTRCPAACGVDWVARPLMLLPLPLLLQRLSLLMMGRSQEELHAGSISGQCVPCFVPFLCALRSLHTVLHYFLHIFVLVFVLRFVVLHAFLFSFGHSPCDAQLRLDPAMPHAAYTRMLYIHSLYGIKCRSVCVCVCACVREYIENRSNARENCNVCSLQLLFVVDWLNCRGGG